MIVKLTWHVPNYNAIITIELRAESLQEAGEKAARVIRELAIPSERTTLFYPAEPVVTRGR